MSVDTKYKYRHQRLVKSETSQMIKAKQAWFGCNINGRRGLCVQHVLCVSNVECKLHIASDKQKCSQFCQSSRSTGMYRFVQGKKIEIRIWDSRKAQGADTWRTNSSFKTNKNNNAVHSIKISHNEIWTFSDFAIHLSKLEQVLWKTMANWFLSIKKFCQI